MKSITINLDDSDKNGQAEIKSIKGMRDNLLDDYMKCKNQKISRKHANTLANISGKIMSSLNIELRDRERQDDGRDISFLKYEE